MIEQNAIEVHNGADERARKPWTAAKANRLVAEYAISNAGLSFIPVPLLDVVLFSAVQLDMVRNLADHYRIPFSKELAKSLIAAVVGGVLPLTSAVLIRAIPVIGPMLGRASFTVVAGASTYALGKVFIQHFESGGTFLDFDPKAVKEYYVKQYAAAAMRETGGSYAGVKP